MLALRSLARRIEAATVGKTFSDRIGGQRHGATRGSSSCSLRTTQDPAAADGIRCRRPAARQPQLHPPPPSRNRHRRRRLRSRRRPLRTHRRRRSGRSLRRIARRRGPAFSWRGSGRWRARDCSRASVSKPFVAFAACRLTPLLAARCGLGEVCLVIFVPPDRSTVRKHEARRSPVWRRCSA